MGNYLFDPEILVQALTEAHARGEHDFGHHVMPRPSRSARTYAYDFATNRVPGLHPEERGYWRDVGTIEAYREAQREVAGPRRSWRVLPGPEDHVRPHRVGSCIDGLRGLAGLSIRVDSDLAEVMPEPRLHRRTRGRVQRL